MFDPVAFTATVAAPEDKFVKVYICASARCVAKHNNTARTKCVNFEVNTKDIDLFCVKDAFIG
jgi:hypothetical protein